MQKSLQTGHVPSQRIIDEIDYELGCSWPWPFPKTAYDDPSPLSPVEQYWNVDDLRKMLNPQGRSGGWIEFDLADKLLCCLHLTDSWHGRLEDLYLSVNLEPEQPRVRKAPSGEHRCAARGCTNTFIPWGKRNQIYCSQKCGARDRRELAGRYGKRYDKCPNGHDRSPENVAYRKSGAIYCRACNREAAVAKYSSDPEYRERKVLAERERRAARKVAA